MTKYIYEAYKEVIDLKWELRSAYKRIPEVTSASENAEVTNEKKNEK